MHARPISFVGRKLMGMNVKATVSYNGSTADAKSVLSFLTLGIEKGSTVSFSIDGPDEIEAMEYLDWVFSRKRESDLYEKKPGKRKTKEFSLCGFKLRGFSLSRS